MTELALAAFAAFFATIGPLDVGIVFVSITAGEPRKARLRAAIVGIAIATAILLLFALFGSTVLGIFGISLPAFRIAGGILLLLIAIDMVFGRVSGGVSTTPSETREATARRDITVFPLAMPLIAGPGTMGAVILLMADAPDVRAASVVLGALLSVLGLTFVSMLLAVELQTRVGRVGAHGVTRIFGVILAALAVQFVLDGIRESGIAAYP